MPTPAAPFCIPRHEWKRRVQEAHAPLYVHAVGIPYHVQIEQHRDVSRVDHVWLNVEVPPCGPLRLSVNTLSRWNRDAGFDGRIRLGIITSKYTDRPGPLLEEAEPLDYRTLEAAAPTTFTPLERPAFEQLLMRKANAAVRIEAWGELYIRERLGMHQFHSRRASCAVDHDLLAHDGALKFYYPDQIAETLLIKYCGQP
jgi:hypothetical protein